MFRNHQILKNRLRRNDRIRIPPRVSRIDGEFPPIRERRASRAIVDIETLPDDPTGPFESRKSKPHELNEKKDDLNPGNSCFFRETVNPRALHLGRRSEEPGLKAFGFANDAPDMRKDDLIRLKKFRWMPNPFLANNDARQGGPLFYAKYFADRDRRLDEKAVRDELAKQSDALICRADEPPSDRTKTRRKRAVWSNYRAISDAEVSRISSVGKIARILANEVHNISKGEESRRSITDLLESRYGELISTKDHNPDAKEILSVIKAVYQFGLLRKLDPVILNQALELVVGQIRTLKPENLIYLLEALARLGFRDQRTIQIIDSLELCWPVVGKQPVLLLKAANALARLDLVKTSRSGSRIVPVLAERLPDLTRSQLERIKAVTVTELFDDVMILDYLLLCHKAQVEYLRNVVLVYLHVRKREGLVPKLPSATKEWIEEIVQQQISRTEASKGSGSLSSELHQDVARIVKIQHTDATVSQSCGPFVLDIFVPSSNTVIEASAVFQFYARTARFTAEARLRHDLIRGLGFKLVPITHFQWAQLRSDTDKQSFIRNVV